MMCMTDLSNMEQVETLREVIRKCTDCSCVATLKQYVKRPDGSFNSVDLSNVPCDVNAEINVDNETVYIYIKTLERIQLMQLKNMWETKVKRGTQRFMTGQTEDDRLNDYVMVIDLIKDEFENSLIYQLSVPEVKFVSFDEGRDDRMVFMLHISDMYFGVGEMTLQEAEYELQVKEAEENGYGYVDPDLEDEEDEEDNFDDNDDFIGNNDYRGF